MLTYFVFGFLQHVEDGDGPKIKQAKTRNIFCLFVCFCRCCFLLGLRQTICIQFLTWHVASIAACISKWCACGISKRKPWGRVFDTGHKRVTRFRLTFFSLKDVATFPCCSSCFFSDLLLCCKQWNNSCGSLARNG